MKNKKRLIALAIVLTMCLALLAACGPSDPAPAATEPTVPGATEPTAPEGGGMLEEAPPEDDVVFAEHIDIIIDNNNIGVINPFNPAANPTSTNWVFVMVHDRLIERDHDAGVFIASLAHDWNTDDYQTFTFNLREDVYFHNGQQFTADDVLFTIEHAREVGAGSPALAQWGPVASARAIDPFTLELTLTGVNVDFYHNLSVPSAAIVSRSALESDPDTGTFIGTGPYIVDEFVPNDFVRMNRNENFWNERFTIITPIVTLRFVPDMTARTIRMQRGESQLSFGTSADDLPLFQNDPDNFQVLPQTFNTVQGFSFNMNDPLLQDYHLRMAIMHATNREEIALFAANEWATTIYGHPRGGGTIWGYATDFRNNDIPAIPFDLEMAAYHLALSNYNGEELEIAAAIITNIRAAQALQEQLRVAGINARVQEFDSPGLSAYMIDPDGGSQIVFFSLQMNLSAGSARNLFYPGMPQNRMHFNNPEVNELLVEAAGTLDFNTRRDLYMRIQEIVAEDPPFLQVFWRINGTVAVNGLGGIRLPADNLQNDFREIFHVIG